MLGHIVVEPQHGGQLHQNRSHLSSHGFENGEEALQRLFGFPKFFHVREIAAHLRAKQKILRHLRRPLLHGFDGGQAVKAAVDLGGGKELRVVVEPFGGRELLRVKQAFPFLLPQPS